MRFFHASYTRFSQFLASWAADGGFTMADVESERRTFRILDSGKRHLLEAGLVLWEDGSACVLEDAEGDIRWTGVWGDHAELDEHLGGILDSWLLVPVAVVSRIERTFSVLDLSKAGKSNSEQPLEFSIKVEELKLTEVSENLFEGTVVSLAAEPGFKPEMKRFARLLRENGGVSCPNPLLLFYRKAAVAEGWQPEDKIWQGKSQWTDILHQLTWLLQAVRDGRDPASVKESRTLISRLRSLLKLGAVSEGAKPKSVRIEVLDQLYADLGKVEALDWLVFFLEHESDTVSPEWVGVPSVLSLCDGWTSAHSARLVAELSLFRHAQLQAIIDAIPSISSPEAVAESARLWPRFPRLERIDSEYQGRLEAWLSSRIRSLQSAIGDLSEKQSDPVQWRILRRRCKKIYRLLDVSPVLKKTNEARFLKRMVRLWQKRLGVLDDVLSSAELLEELASQTDNPFSLDAAVRLSAALREWVALIVPHLHKTVPALALAARNARKKLA